VDARLLRFDSVTSAYHVDWDLPDFLSLLMELA
jgi:hypothetical protein